jgi:hypothetical protein
VSDLELRGAVYVQTAKLPVTVADWFLRVACFVKNVRQSLWWDRFGRFKTNLIRLVF